MSPGVPQGGNDDIRPDPLPVLPPPPALVFKLTRLGCYLQCLLRLTLLNVFFGVKAGEMLTNDLFSSITLNALSPFIPTHHTPVWVQHDNGIVFHALKQQAEAL